MSGIITAFQAALNGLTVPWQILSIERPVELDSYLESLDRQIADADPQREPLLREYLHWVSGLGPKNLPNVAIMLVLPPTIAVPASTFFMLWLCWATFARSVSNCVRAHETPAWHHRRQWLVRRSNRMPR